MKIISYNVNGIRAALRKDFLEWLKAASPDVLCLQEIKATPDQFDSSVFKKNGVSPQLLVSRPKKRI
jgi:exodeoxyribonuclease-3